MAVAVAASRYSMPRDIVGTAVGYTETDTGTTCSVAVDCGMGLEEFGGLGLREDSKRNRKVL